MCSELDDYNVEIDAQLYDNDYDEVNTEQNELTQAESDILFE